MFNYYKKSFGGEWEEISEDVMSIQIASMFGVARSIDWTGTELPSQAEAWERLHNGEQMHTYTAAYKADQAPAMVDTGEYNG